MRAKVAEKKEAIRLRVEDRLSVKEIAKKLGVSKASVSNWIRPYPLTPDERHERQASNGKQSGRIRRARKLRHESRLHRLLKGRPLTFHNKGKIAEAATLMRLTLFGFGVYGSPFDGDQLDWVVDTKQALVRVQVKWARRDKYGSPFARLRKAAGRGKSQLYQLGDFDFLVLYDLYTDACYVWSWEEVKGKSSLSCADEAEERWDKLGSVV